MKLFIDDIREPPDDSWLVVRTSREAIKYFVEYGIPENISFDHDLGDESGSGYDVAKALIELDMDGFHIIPYNFQFNVHSANPVGASNIRGLLHSYLRFRNERNNRL